MKDINMKDDLKSDIPDCPICKDEKLSGTKTSLGLGELTGLANPVILQNLADPSGSTITLSREEYLNIEKVARAVADVSEMKGEFAVTSGLAWVDIPLSKGMITLSVRKNISAAGKPEYAWMIEKK